MVRLREVVHRLSGVVSHSCCDLTKRPGGEKTLALCKKKQLHTLNLNLTRRTGLTQQSGCNPQKVIDGDVYKPINKRCCCEQDQ